jgi:putative ATPase
MRGSDPDAALYWMARMLEGGEDAMFIARRMVIFASEDIGNADLRALPLAVAAMQTINLIGMPEARITLGQACTYLASAPKSNASYLAINSALSFVRTDGARKVPPNIADPPVGYQYPHDHPYGFVDQNHWPLDMPQKRFYEPTSFGDEKTIGQRLEWWRSKDKKK